MNIFGSFTRGGEGDGGRGGCCAALTIPCGSCTARRVGSLRAANGARANHASEQSLATRNAILAKWAHLHRRLTPEASQHTSLAWAKQLDGCRVAPASAAPSIRPWCRFHREACLHRWQHPTTPHYYTYREVASSRSRFRHAVIVISPIRSSGGGLALFQDVYFSDHICVASGPWPYISQSSKPQAASAASIRSASAAGHRPSSEQSSAPWYYWPALRAAPL